MNEKPLLFIAEDDADDQLLLLSAFEELQLNYMPQFVENGEQLWQKLLTILENGNRLPGLIMIDLNMPLLGGRELLQKLKKNQNLAHIPVLIITTSSAPGEVKKAYADGAAAFITKPASFDGLLNMVKLIHDFYFKLVILSEN